MLTKFALHIINIRLFHREQSGFRKFINYNGIEVFVRQETFEEKNEHL